MSDVVVTVPKNFTHPAAPGLRGLAAWLAEGDPPGAPESGQEWWFTTSGFIPSIIPGDRVYVVCEGRLVGYSPLVSCMYDDSRLIHGRSYYGPIALVRKGGAVAVTIDERTAGFAGGVIAGGIVRTSDRFVPVNVPYWSKRMAKKRKAISKHKRGANVLHVTWKQVAWGLRTVSILPPLAYSDVNLIKATDDGVEVHYTYQPRPGELCDERSERPTEDQNQNL